MILIQLVVRAAKCKFIVLLYLLGAAHSAVETTSTHKTQVQF